MQPNPAPPIRGLAMRRAISADVSKAAGNGKREELPPTPANIRHRPIEMPPMENVKGDRPPEFEGESW